MVAINKILLSGCTGEGCGGETGTCTDSPIHRGNAENRVPATRNHRRGVTPGRWLTRDPIGYQGGINLYGYVGSSPVGNVDAEGTWYTKVLGPIGPFFDPALGGCVWGFEHIVTPSWWNLLFSTHPTRTYYTYYPIRSGISWTPATCRPDFPGICFTEYERAELEKNLANAMVVEMGLQALRNSQYTEMEEGLFGIAGGGAGDAGSDVGSAAISGAGGVFGVTH